VCTLGNSSTLHAVCMDIRDGFLIYLARCAAEWARLAIALEVQEADDRKHVWQDVGEQDYDAICQRHEHHRPLAKASERKPQAPIAKAPNPTTTRPGPIPGPAAQLLQQQMHRKIVGMCIAEIDGTLQVSGSLACASVLSDSSTLSCLVADMYVCVCVCARACGRPKPIQPYRHQSPRAYRKNTPDF
jgi:hypothetical protein